MSHLTAGPVLRELLEASIPHSAGATVEFWGTVRNQHLGERVTGIHYHAYEPLAEARLAALEAAAVARHDLDYCIVRHAVGELGLGDASVAIICCSAHREPAFEACRWLIDTIKETVPIWKQERFPENPPRFVTGTPIQSL